MTSPKMFQQLDAIEQRFVDIERRMGDPEVISNQKEYQDILKKHSELREGVDVYRAFKKLLKEREEAEELLADPEMKAMAKEELDRISQELEIQEEALQAFLIPPDPDDHKNAIVEIRSGTGGDEAALFASELYRMYARFAEDNRWTIEIMSENLTELGGVKEIVFAVKGNNVYHKLKFESGTHRVQRVPETEASGRLHTSAATVAILPEAEEVDVAINPTDLRIDTYRASGAGGQHVNKTDSAVRITHIPTGVVVACQDERSQFQNKDKAMRLLRTRLYEKQLEDRIKNQAQNRKLQVGTGDRSQKIRTYNYPQNRITDHRINFTLYNLDGVLQGDLSELIEALLKEERIEKMKAQ